MAMKQTCKRCCKKIFIDFNIKDEIWDKLPKEWKNVVLCFDCFLELLEKNNPKISLKREDFTWIGICGDLNSDGELLAPGMWIDLIELDPLSLEKETIDRLNLFKDADWELAHSQGDTILCDLLRSLGYGKVVEVWEELDKKYA